MSDQLNTIIESLKQENEALKEQINTQISKAKRKKETTKKTLGWAWRLFAGESLFKNFNDWFSEYNNKEKVSAKASASLLTSLVQRFIRIRFLSLLLLVFSAIPSLITLFVLVQQNDLIKTQNALVESSKKSSYNFQLANIYNQIDRSSGILDDTLTARIIGITNSLKPYRILEDNGELSKKPYSLERSQLLLFLLNAGVPNYSLKKVFDSADFSHCDLRSTNLTNKYLEGINLSHSNLENTELHSSNLNEADLTSANLKGLQFSNGSAKNAIFKDADLSNAKINRTNLNGVNLSSAKTKNAKIIPLK